MSFLRSQREWKLWNASVALAAHSFTDFNLHIPANALLFAVVVAITYVAVFNLSDHRGTSILTANASPLTLYASRLAILLFGSLLLYIPTAGFIADYHYEDRSYPR